MVDQPKTSQKKTAETAHLERRIRELETAKARTEAFYRSLLDDAPLLICRYLPDFTISYVNNLCCANFRKSADELVGTSLLSLIPEEDREAVKANISLLTVAKPTHRRERQVSPPDGDIRWQRWTDRAIFDEQGSITAYQTIGEDITEQKRLYSELRDKDRTMKAFFDAVQESMVLIDTEGIVLLSNATGARRLGKTVREFEGTPLYDHFPPEVASLRKSQYEQVIATGEPVAFKDTRAGRIFQQRCYPVFTDEKKVFGVAIFAHDETELHQVHEALQASEEKYRSLFEESNDAILLTVPDGQILDANPAACRMFGRSVDELRAIGRNGVLDVSDPRLPVQLEERRRTGRMVNAELTHLRADGKKFPAEVTSQIFTDGKGRQRTSMIVRDVSERKQLEGLLKEREIRLDKLTAHAPGMIYQFMRKPDGTFCLPFSTEAIRDVFGCSPDEVRENYAPIVNAVVPEDLDKLLGSIESSAEQMTVWECDFRVQIPGKPVRWIMGKSTPEKLPDGSVLWHGFAMDTTERRQSYEDLRLANKRLEALWNVTLLPADDIKGVADQVLRSILELTDSPLAFFGYMNADESVMTTHAFSPEALKECAVTNVPRDFPISDAGLWAEAIRKRSPLIVNDCAAPSPASNGLPEGHVALKNLMVVPLFSKGKITAVAAVANKAVDYDHRDVNVVTSFLRSIESIVEIREAQEALRESEEKYRALFENAGEAIFVAQDGRVVFLNPVTTRIAGYSGEEFALRPFTDFIHPDDRDMILDRHTRRLHGEDIPRRYTFRVIHKNDRLVWVQLDTILIDWQGKPATLNFMIDVTERKRAEEIEKETHALLRIAGEKAKLGGWSVNLEENRVTWSDEVAAIHEMPAGYSPTVEQGISFYTPEWHERITKVFTDCAQKGIPYDEEMEMITAGGKRVWVRTIGEAVKDNAGKIVKVQGAFQDITNRKQAEEEIRRLNEELERRVQVRTAQLELSNKELESFAYSVSHDLRAPLRGIDGWSLALLEDYGEKLDGQARGYIDLVRKGTQLMGTLIDDLLNLSRVTRAELKLMPIDLSALAREIADRVRSDSPHGPEKRPVELTIAAGLQATGDRHLLEIALFNLFDNAFKFSSMRCPGRIEFGETRIEGEKAFFIGDNGVGFDMAYAAKLFGAFQRLHKSSDFPGTGVGLATVQRIVHRHNGRIWAEAAPDRGATFYFTLGKRM